MIRRLEFDDNKLAAELFGPHNRNLKLISEGSGVALDSRGNFVVLDGDDEQTLESVSSLMVQLYGRLRAGRSVGPNDIDQGLKMLETNPKADIAGVFDGTTIRVSKKSKISPKSLTQKEYFEAIDDNDMVFGIGPAGTGKTYLAVAMAVAALTQRKVKRLVLTRPAVEAGEHLGFLPGDLVEKINPYLRPLYDALHDMLDFGKVQEMMETGRIEIAPLAFMRGRTLNDAFIILDEAQNTTPEQMKMFLTRLGFNSKAVITGDVTQIDLPRNSASGLVNAVNILEKVRGIRVIRFKKDDVIRHPLVGRIVDAYECHAAEKDKEKR
ncbi:MAG: PhoH family protein [Desulfovibrio sp.]|uniref:PhoH family protein n=1 Tax=Desulfovibrio sp. 7SRBS1 TaxID=3378064 RepID=UPI003B3EFE9B